MDTDGRSSTGAGRGRAVTGDEGPPDRAVTGDEVAPAQVPRLVAWLRGERPRTTDAELRALLAGLPAERVHRLERLLDDLARGCRAPGAADLAALTGLDDLLARGSGN